MRMDIQGRARVLGDNVNTDYIIQSSRKKETLNPKILRQYLLESVDPSFASSIQPGDLLVAGKNFGCGSAMEVAVTVVLAAGIQAVLAGSFARTYYRNAVNNGLIPVECDTSAICEGQRLRVLLDDAGVRVLNVVTGAEISGLPLPGIMLDILGAGGLVPYFKAHGGFVVRNCGRNPVSPG
jgi:3-isopropylmalate/(R)-2-methylmalate dehydratase small subunit